VIPLHAQPLKVASIENQRSKVGVDGLQERLGRS
jgi:hypothetical protein